MKNIAICCDGTWQGLASNRLTNVAHVARALAPRDGEGRTQVLYYASGVGVSWGGNSTLAGAFGWGLDESLIEAYKFLCLNYEPGDHLYFFGFSRGAYTVRSLCGLIRKCGILRRQEVHQAAAALKLYRKRDESPDGDEAGRFRARFSVGWPRIGSGDTAVGLLSAGAGAVDVRIRYLGVWDTVGALGIPRTLPFAMPINRKYQFHDTKLSRSVQNARHAVAIDERRNAFAPTLWTNVEEVNGRAHPAPVQQLWFPGDHGSVGGGGDTQALSAEALGWVVRGAQELGLALEDGPDTVLGQIYAAADPARGSLTARKPRVSLLAVATKLAGGKTRAGLGRFDQLSRPARLRALTTRPKGKKAVPAYAPTQVKRLGGWLEVWNRYANRGPGEG